MRLMIRQHKKVKGAGLSEESNIVVFFSHKMNICQVQLKCIDVLMMSIYGCKGL